MLAIWKNVNDEFDQTPYDPIISFTWEEVISVAGGEDKLGELTRNQLHTFRKCFEEGICSDWDEVARTALSIAQAETDGHISDTFPRYFVPYGNGKLTIRLYIWP